MTAAPKVGVNLLWCRPGQVGGSEEYLTRTLGALPTGTSLTLFVLPAFPRAHPVLAARHSVVTAPVSGARRTVRVAAEHSWLSARLGGVEVIHHAGGTAAWAPGRHGVVLTVHDVQYLTYPQHFSDVKRRFLGHQVPRSVARADVVTAPSAYVATTLVERLGAPADAVMVVSHALPADFATAPFDDALVRRTYHIPGPFLLYPAMTHPHKHHIDAVEALARLRPRHPDLRLVLIGGVGSAERAVRERIAKLGLGDVVVRAGRVPDSDRDALLRMADVLVFPSRYEGFGAPALEAMTVGTPVVAARATALPEVVGDAGLLVEPGDLDGWVDAIDHVLNEPGVAERLAERGRVRAARFDLARSSATLDQAYRRAAEDRLR